MSSANAIFFDGNTSDRHEVVLDLSQPDALEVQSAAGDVLASWPWGDIRRVSRTDRVLRLSCVSAPPMARLEVTDQGLAAAIVARADGLERARTLERRSHVKLIGWSVAAAVSVVTFGIFGIPALADSIAPALPWSVDQRIGEAMDPQIRWLFARGDEGNAECGSANRAEQGGRRALDALVARFEDKAGLPVPLKVAVLRTSMSNAVAAPGGYIYILQGLIDESQTPDELAGVLAHEIGHVHARDGTRRLLQSSGMAFLFGTLLGDFTGGGAIILGGRMLTEAAYSREAEAQADQYAADIMLGLNADPSAMGQLLMRITGEKEDDKPGVTTIFDSHPFTPERLARLQELAGESAKEPLLTENEWLALKSICGMRFKRKSSDNPPP